MADATPAPGIDLEARYNAMLEEVRGNTAVTVLELQNELLSESGRDATGMLEKLRSLLKVEVDPAFERCFFPFKRVALQWRVADPEGDEGGEMSVPNLYSAVRKSLTLATPAMSQADQDLLRRFRLIDDQPSSGMGRLAAVRVESGKLTPGVWFVDVKRATLPLDVDYCGYLEALLDTKGYYGWQYLFADINLSAPENRNLRADLARMLELLPKLFPGHDYTPLTTRFEERSRARGKK